jgi:hypothetical protein
MHGTEELVGREHVEAQLPSTAISSATVGS